MLRMKWIYDNYKAAFLLSVIMITSAIFNKCETVVLLDAVFIHTHSLQTAVIYLQQDHQHLNYDICPPRPHFTNYTHSDQRQLVFFWSFEQFYVVVEIYTLYSPIFSTLFAGIYSDKYGGRNAVLAGLVLGGLVASTTYLTNLHNDHLFLAMLILRKIAEGMIVSGNWSLAGKWATPHSRTVFVSIIFIGEALGEFIGNSMLRMKISWRTFCYFCTGMNFVTAISWWVLSRYQCVPKPRRFTLVPWKDMIMSKSLYLVAILILSCTIIESITETQVILYTFQIINLQYSLGWLVDPFLFLAKTGALLICGAASDYVVVNGLLTASTIRRGISGLLFPFFYCTLFIVKIVRCNLELVLACCVVLHFIYAVFKTTSYTATLDITSAFSGIVFAIVIWVSKLLDSKIRQLIAKFTKIGYSIKIWNRLFFLSAVLATLFAIPFILFGVKKQPWSDGVASRSERKVKAQVSLSKASESSPGTSRSNQN